MSAEACRFRIAALLSALRYGRASQIPNSPAATATDATFSTSGTPSERRARIATGAKTSVSRTARAQVLTDFMGRAYSLLILTTSALLALCGHRWDDHSGA